MLPLALEKADLQIEVAGRAPFAACSRDFQSPAATQSAVRPPTRRTWPIRRAPREDRLGSSGERRQGSRPTASRSRGRASQHPWPQDAPAHWSAAGHSRRDVGPPLRLARRTRDLDGEQVFATQIDSGRCVGHRRFLGQQGWRQARDPGQHSRTEHRPACRWQHSSFSNQKKDRASLAIDAPRAGIACPGAARDPLSAQRGSRPCDSRPIMQRPLPGRSLETETPASCSPPCRWPSGCVAADGPRRQQVSGLKEALMTNPPAVDEPQRGAAGSRRSCNGATCSPPAARSGSASWC